MTEAAPVLQVKDLRKSCGRTEALRGLTFDLRPAELAGPLGPNGAGKSTLFQICAGLFAPDGGSVRVFGKSYREHATEILAGRALRSTHVLEQAAVVAVEMHQAGLAQVAVWNTTFPRWASPLGNGGIRCRVIGAVPAAWPSRLAGRFFLHNRWRERLIGVKRTPGISRIVAVPEITTARRYDHVASHR